MAWWALAGAALGALAGAQKDRVKGSQRVDVGAASELEQAATAGISRDYTNLQSMMNAGATQQDAQKATAYQRNLADMLSKYAQGGFLPSEEDTTTAQQFAATQFQPQQVALQQSFGQQQQRAAQLASQLGRPVNDPIIQAKLSQEMMQGQERLAASQGAFASQFAMNLPQQRLGYTAQLADVQNSLASQAMANRQALLSLGSQIQGAERNWRLGTGTTYTDQESGGGFKGMLTGAMGGASAMMGMGNMFKQGQYLDKLNASQATTADPGVGLRGTATMMPSVDGGGSYQAAAPAMQAAMATPASSNIPYSLQQPNMFNTMFSAAAGMGGGAMMSPAFNYYGRMGNFVAPPVERLQFNTNYLPSGNVANPMQLNWTRR